MPADLYLLRHGESEGNLATRASRNGDDSLLTEGFYATHSSRWRLTEEGRRQAESAGEWLRVNAGGFDRLYVSEYVRALETAALLGLCEGDEGEWMISQMLRERWYGRFDRLSDAEARRQYAASFADRETAPYYWRPPDGESLVEVCARLRHVLASLHRECDGGRALIVCHGEVMEAFRIELERMSEHQYKEWEIAKRERPELKINNTQIWHYTRRADPESDSSKLARYLTWRRSVLPYTGYEGPWERIERRRYTDSDLLALAESAPALFGAEPKRRVDLAGSWPSGADGSDSDARRYGPIDRRAPGRARRRLDGYRT